MVLRTVLVSACNQACLVGALAPIVRVFDSLSVVLAVRSIIAWLRHHVTLQIGRRQRLLANCA